MANQLWKQQQLLYRNCLKEIRNKAGLTQTELAQRLEKPQSYISKYESGERKLDYLEVREICAACNSSIADFETMLAGLISSQRSKHRKW